MTFSPASSIAPTSVTVSGTVSADVTDRAARLVGHTNVDNFPASQVVTGPLTAAELAALEPLAVTGPVTNAQLRASAVPVDGSAVTQPVSAAALPLPAGAAKDSTLTDGTARVGGTVTVGDGGGSLSVDDGGSSLTVDGTVAVSALAGTVDVSDRAGRLAGVVSGGANVFHVDDNGASLTVDGPLTDAQLAARLPLGVTGPLTDTQLRASAVPVDVSDRIGRLVGIVSGAANVFHVDDNGSSLTVDGPLTDAQLRAAAVPISDGGTSITVDGTVAATQGTSPWVTDGSAVTQPVSADSLPLPDGAATEDTLDHASESLNDVALTAILQRDKLAIP